MEKYYITIDHIIARIKYLAVHFDNNSVIYGVPRGGVPVALAMSFAYGCKVTANPEDATHIVDDLIDSGTTKDRYLDLCPNADFIALYNKKMEFSGNPWLCFAWEGSEKTEDTSTDDIFTRLLQYIGEDVEREGLKDTPKRMAKAWLEWTSGYQMKPEDFSTVFKDDTAEYNQIILLKDIPYYSHCEHHCSPFYGKAHIGYIPKDGVVIGISKLARILDMYSKRLQIQEKMTKQIADCIEEILDPLGVAVVVTGKHLCMETRGVNKTGQTMVTSAMRGVFMENGEARSEFMQLIA